MADKLRPFHEMVSEELFNALQTIETNTETDVAVIGCCLRILLKSEMPVEAAFDIAEALIKKGVKHKLVELKHHGTAMLVHSTTSSLLGR